ncbi:MAG: hypothetical protein ACYTFV_17855, partial [Planctomycetota bacterium]
TVRIPVLRNGDFESPLPPSDDPELAGRLPWWKVLSGDPSVARDERGPFLWMQAGDIVQQPMAAWAGAADEIQITLDTAGHTGRRTRRLGGGRAAVRSAGQAHGVQLRHGRSPARDRSTRRATLQSPVPL